MTKTLEIAKLGCTKCGATFSISFKNKAYPIDEYAMAIENKIGQGCPDCKGKLVIIPDDFVIEEEL
jgi:transcription elongation factor Elf1